MSDGRGYIFRHIAQHTVGVILGWCHKEVNQAIAVCEVIPEVLILRWPRTFAKWRPAN